MVFDTNKTMGYNYLLIFIKILMIEKLIHRIFEPLYTSSERSSWEMIQYMKMKKINEIELSPRKAILLSTPFMEGDLKHPHFSYIYTTPNQTEFIVKNRDQTVFVDIKAEEKYSLLINEKKEEIKENGRIALWDEEKFRIVTIDYLSGWKDGEIVSEDYILSAVL